MHSGGKRGCAWWRAMIDPAPMTLEQLRVFVAVAEALHVTRAAEALGLGQSSVSGSLRALEERLGAALFDRVGRHIELTEAGRVLLPEARAVLARAAQCAEVLAEQQGLARGRLRLWASQTIAAHFLPRRIVAFQAAYPGIGVRVWAGNTAEVARAVELGDADLGFVEGAVESPLLARIEVGGDRLVLVASPALAAPWRGGMGPGDLACMRFVLRERGSGTRQVFEDALVAMGVDPRGLTVGLELPSNEAVRSAVEEGAGVTAISGEVVAAPLRFGTLVALPLALPGRPYHALRHGDRHRSRAETAFLDLLRRSRAPVTPP